MKLSLFALILSSFIVILAPSFGQSSLLDKVPTDVREDFVESLVYVEGLFKGAEIAYLKPYLTKEEIDEVIQSYIRTDAGGVALQRVAFDGYKPKHRGCKENPRWICIVTVDEVRE
ncbi:MAG: hypothetical protein NZM43_11490 [Saprospiraceae bacterium]|nr:hypothetical protein [Saprospiraceae bacterium]MDW8484931.1 hypothetical protein [Saprospiraceae bacterium]